MRRLAIAILVLVAGAAPQGPLDPHVFGARGDGATKDTRAIQAAIDAAEKRGGGTVALGAGRYLAGTIHLKSNVTLHLENGAVLLASRDDADFDPYEPLDFKPPDDKETTFFRFALIAGEKIHDAAITGTGAIDGNREKRGGPKTIALKLAERVTIRGITVRNSPNYSISLLGCDDVLVDGVRILNSYADGIDPDSSRFVRIANSYIDSHDDAICPKSSFALGYRRAAEHIAVTNCTTRTDANHFKLGTESEGGFRDITASNLTMLNREGPNVERRGRAKSGISLEMVDGGTLERVAISNVTMDSPQVAIFVRLGNRGRSQETPLTGALRDVSIANVIATGVRAASSITGLSGAPARFVTLDNISIEAEGGFAGEIPARIPEFPAKYPDATMFGELPAFGLYARHVDSLTLRQIRLRSAKPDPRQAVVLDDVRETKP